MINSVEIGQSRTGAVTAQLSPSAAATKPRQAAARMHKADAKTFTVRGGVEFHCVKRPGVFNKH